MCWRYLGLPHPSKPALANTAKQRESNSLADFSPVHKQMVKFSNLFAICK